MGKESIAVLKKTHIYGWRRFFFFFYLTKTQAITYFVAQYSCSYHTDLWYMSDFWKRFKSSSVVLVMLLATVADVEFDSGGDTFWLGDLYNISGQHIDSPLSGNRNGIAWLAIPHHSYIAQRCASGKTTLLCVFVSVHVTVNMCVWEPVCLFVSVFPIPCRKSS